MHARAALRLSVFIVGLSALASAQTSTLSVTPNPAPANQAFTLTLQGMPVSNCMGASRESVTVSGNRIDLFYTPARSILYSPVAANSARAESSVTVSFACPVMANGTSGVDTTRLPSALVNAPRFNVPPLQAGVYEVWATSVPECYYSGCKIAITPVSAGNLVVQKQQTALTYTFTPSSAPAGQGFDLHLLSYGFTCATVYENLAVYVIGNVINLSFFDREQTGILCPAIYMPYGPTFKIPALAAGTYEVRVDRNAMNAEITVGNLQITGAAVHKGWYLKQKTEPPNAPFQMQLLKDSLAACTTFSNLSAVVSTSGITASFLMETGKCSQVAQDTIGPVFTMPALKAGAYPVYVRELLPCMVGGPTICAVDVVATVPSDTLLVGNSLAMRMSDLRAGAPKVDVVGTTAFFVLPDDGMAGPWRAELMTLDGRVLAAKSLTGAPGERVSMPVDRARTNAVSLLRLTSPAGTQRFMPIVR